MFAFYPIAQRVALGIGQREAGNKGVTKMYSDEHCGIGTYSGPGSEGQQAIAVLSDAALPYTYSRRIIEL